MDEPLWTPSRSRQRATRLAAFIDRVAERDPAVRDYATLYEWSVREPEAFWRAVWDFCDVVADRRSDRVLVDGDRMPGARWFPDARLNFAANVLRPRDDSDAIVFWGETEMRRRLTRHELYDQVSRMVAAYRAWGIQPGDRVAAFLPNIPETVVAALAAACVGATWSSCSPDFGVQGALDRFGQLDPKILLTADGYLYNGKRFDSLDKARGIARGLPTLQRTVAIPYTRATPLLHDLPHVVTYPEVMAEFPATEIEFASLPFDHPLYVMFSSGTTGVPKSIVHGAGGTLLQHLKEHQLHCDIRPADRVFYFTTCGWMMWNWLVSALASDATIILYDGSPFWPDGNTLFDLADAEAMTLFGTSAKFIDACRKAGVEPRRTHRLEHLRTMTSTGSPLVPESFDYVYERVKADLHLASITGGTDILSCFAGGNPIGPVWRGELQARALAMGVDVFDDNGQSVRGAKGELVCTAPFPSMPVGFWNDPDGVAYRRAYFDRYPNVWTHGDWVELTAHDGLIVYGRSDATLNPGGVRIGTAEIYRQVEQFDEVLEAVCVGQEWEDDTRIVLFVRLRGSMQLTSDLAQRIRNRIREQCTPRHVPAKIVPIADIPRTRSGKIAELAVRDTIHGRPVKNVEALANPESLELYVGMGIRGNG